MRDTLVIELTHEQSLLVDETLIMPSVSARMYSVYRKNLYADFRACESPQIFISETARCPNVLPAS